MYIYICRKYIKTLEDFRSINTIIENVIIEVIMLVILKIINFLYLLILLLKRIKISSYIILIF